MDSGDTLLSLGLLAFLVRLWDLFAESEPNVALGYQSLIVAGKVRLRGEQWYRVLTTFPFGASIGIQVKRNQGVG